MGSKKELIAYEGIIEATDLIRTVQPAWDNVLACHPSILLETFSKMSLKATDFDLPKKKEVNLGILRRSKPFCIGICH